jgi:hypothetical protein
MRPPTQFRFITNSIKCNDIDYAREENSRFSCKLCLWTFETEAELDNHNYLEHMIIKHSRKSSSDSRIVNNDQAK